MLVNGSIPNGTIRLLLSQLGIYHINHDKLEQIKQSFNGSLIIIDYTQIAQNIAGKPHFNFGTHNTVIRHHAESFHALLKVLGAKQVVLISPILSIEKNPSLKDTLSMLGQDNSIIYDQCLEIDTLNSNTICINKKQLYDSYLPQDKKVLGVASSTKILSSFINADIPNITFSKSFNGDAQSLSKDLSWDKQLSDTCYRDIFLSLLKIMEADHKQTYNIFDINSLFDLLHKQKNSNYN
jgi:hypothetical protein